VLSKYKVFTGFCYLLIILVLHILKIKLSCKVQDKINNAFEWLGGTVMIFASRSHKQHS